MNAGAAPTVLIRAAAPADRDAVHRIAARALRDYGLEPDFAGLDLDLGRIGTGHPSAVAEHVAVLDGEVCGSVVVVARAPGLAKLNGFYVDASVRGRGIGRRLLAAAVQAAADAGYDEIRLETWGRMHAAVTLYEATGWVRGPDVPASSGADRTYTLSLTGSHRRGACGFSAEFIDPAATDWAATRNLRLGSGPRHFPPDACVGIRERSQPALRLDLGIDCEAAIFRAIRASGSTVAVGFGEHLYLVDVHEGVVATIHQDGYFGALYTPDDFALPPETFDLLCASATALSHITWRGETAWHAGELGTDGILVHAVLDGLVRGSAEQDPPGQWQDFAVDLATGALKPLDRVLSAP